MHAATAPVQLDLNASSYRRCSEAGGHALLNSLHIPTLRYRAVHSSHNVLFHLCSLADVLSLIYLLCKPCVQFPALPDAFNVPYN